MTDALVFPLVGKRINTATEEEVDRRMRMLMHVVRQSFRDRVSVQTKWDQRKRARLENAVCELGSPSPARKI